jgi:peptidoglycan hydrolase-like protein with peptidoglycan-binding domain
MRNPGSRELRRRQARLESQQRTAVREQTPTPRRAEMMRRGGLLEGLAPGIVFRLTVIVTAVSLLLIAAAVLGVLVEIGQHDLVLGVVVLLVALVITGIVGSVTAPAMRAARRDRRLPAQSIQGPLVGASLVSPTPGLATVAITVGKNVEQFRVRPELFDKLRGGATVVGLTITPGLNHVQALAVIRRDRLATMTTPPVTRAIRISVWLPLVSMAAVVIALALGGLVGALLPLGRSDLHPLVTAVLVVALAGAVALFTRWYGGRLVKQLGLDT